MLFPQPVRATCWTGSKVGKAMLISLVLRPSKFQAALWLRSVAVRVRAPMSQKHNPLNQNPKPVPQLPTRWFYVRYKLALRPVGGASSSSMGTRLGQKSHPPIDGFPTHVDLELPVHNMYGIYQFERELKDRLLMPEYFPVRLFWHDTAWEKLLQAHGVNWETCMSQVRHRLLLCEFRRSLRPCRVLNVDAN